MGEKDASPYLEYNKEPPFIISTKCTIYGPGPGGITESQVIFSGKNLSDRT